MKYRIKKETKPTLPTYGKYKAVAVHYQTVESKQFVNETAQRMGTQALCQGITFEKDKNG